MDVWRKLHVAPGIFIKPYVPRSIMLSAPSIFNSDRNLISRHTGTIFAIPNVRSGGVVFIFIGIEIE